MTEQKITRSRAMELLKEKQEELNRLGVERRYFNRDLDECCTEIQNEVEKMLN